MVDTYLAIQIHILGFYHRQCVNEKKYLSIVIFISQAIISFDFFICNLYKVDQKTIFNVFAIKITEGSNTSITCTDKRNLLKTKYPSWYKKLKQYTENM